MPRYSDVFCRSKSGQLMAFYVCMSTGWDPRRPFCGTVTGSKLWDRKLAVDQPKQVWYCPVCGASYKTKFGMLLEFLVHGQPMFMRGVVPDQHVHDLRNMHTQAQMGDDVQAEALWRSIENYKVTDPGLLLKEYDLPMEWLQRPKCFLDELAKAEEGKEPKLFQVKNWDVWNSLEQFRWEEVFRLAKPELYQDVCKKIPGTFVNALDDIPEERRPDW